MTSKYPLTESGRATADASGIATVQMRSAISGEWWRVKSTSVSGNSALEPQAKVYKGFVSESALIGGSASGNLDSGYGDDLIEPGVAVIVQWTQATAGAQFTATIQGERWRG